MSKIIELKGATPTDGKVYVELKDIIPEILPELEAEHKKWLKMGFKGRHTRFGTEPQNFIQYLENRYNLKKKTTK